jgi:glyoxylase-like metal-dependent hydrolase (beta-lactamase superfamily II)
MFKPFQRTIGRYTISKITELELRDFSPARLFPQFEDQATDPTLFPASLLSPEGNIILSSHSWLLQDGRQTILVDTGVGARKSRPFAPYFDNLSPPYLNHLEAVGVRPEDVDLILLTHLHGDHIGWNTIWDGAIWRSTFPKARYVFSAEEYDFFSSPENHVDRHRTSFMARADSVDPVVSAGQAVMIPIDGSEVFPGIRYLSTPGHSPFHASIAINTGEGTALFAGDTLHHHAQVLRPEVNSIFDADPDLARHSRDIVLDTASTPGTILFGAHLAGSSAIKITKTAKGYRWQEA